MNKNIIANGSEILLPVPGDDKIRQAQKLMGEKVPNGTTEVFDGGVFTVSIIGMTTEFAIICQKLELLCARIVPPYRPLTSFEDDEDGDDDYGDDSDYSFGYLRLFEENTYKLEIPVDANNDLYAQLVLSAFAGNLPDQPFRYSELAGRNIRLFFNGDGEKYADSELLGIRPVTDVWWE